MGNTVDPKYRPPEEERWTDGMRTDPARITMRTEWLYSENPRISPSGEQSYWPYSREGNIVSADISKKGLSSRDLYGHVHSAVAAFGDDKDLIVEVRLADADPTDAEVEALAMGMWKHSGEERHWDEVAEQWLHLARMGLRSMRAECTPNTPNTSVA